MDKKMVTKLVKTIIKLFYNALVKKKKKNKIQKGEAPNGNKEH